MAGALLPARSTSAPSPAEENVLAQQAEHCPGPLSGRLFIIKRLSHFPHEHTSTHF
jgi:hypothetical protein